MAPNSIGRASAGEDQEQRLASLADHDPATPTAPRDDGAVPGAKARLRTMPVKIVRDYWADEDARGEWPSPANNRIAAGRVVALAVREARRLIEAGVAERADPLPQE
jgi:hypothetical protein